MLHSQTTINLAKQLITFLKVNSLLQINLYGWGICTPFVNSGVNLNANHNGIQLTGYFYYTLANTLTDGSYVTYRLIISILQDFTKSSLWARTSKKPLDLQKHTISLQKIFKKV